jgi:hypothetical protein
MWIQKDNLKQEIGWDKVLDWVVIDGVMWVEIQEKEVRDECIVRC